MVAAAIIIAVILLIAFLRIGAVAEYSEDGFEVAARVGPFSLKVFPAVEKPGAAERKALRKARKEERAKRKPKKEKKPKTKMAGGLRAFLDMLPPAMDMLGRLKRRLLIKKLIVHYYVSGDDPAMTAMLYGASNAVFSAITPVIENNFRIRRRELRSFPGFTEFEQRIYVKAAISIAVWEVFYIVFALFPILKIVLRRTPVNNDRKEEEKNGQAPDK